MPELLKESNRFVHTPCLQMKHWNLSEAGLFAQGSSTSGKMSVAEGPEVAPQIHGLGQALKKLPSVTEKQTCFHMNCLTWEGSRVTNWASPAPALFLLKWCAQSKPLV